MAYELKINVKRGTVHGGGLANNSYVEVWIDGMLIETTASVPSPPEWNKEVTKEFDTLEHVAPIVVSFCMYKKRWTSEGFKLVGSSQFLLSDIASKLNKGPTTKNMSLIASKKNITLSGTITAEVELTGGPPADEEIEEYSREKKLMNRASMRLTRNDNTLSKMMSILTPKPKSEERSEESAELGAVSKAYRYVFHFDNQTFGRFIKVVVLALWLVLLKYNMDMWLNMKEKTHSMDGSLQSIINIFQELNRKMKNEK